jgi:hypothetical protein
MAASVAFLSVAGVDGVGLSASFFSWGLCRGAYRCVGLATRTQQMRAIAAAGMLGLGSTPGGPACGFSAGIDQLYAINRADGNAQLAARAMLGNHGMHALVGTQNRIGRAGLDAQRAAYAPGFVDHGQGARASMPFSALSGNSACR